MSLRALSPADTQLGQEEWATGSPVSASQQDPHLKALPRPRGCCHWVRVALAPSKEALPGAGGWGKPALLAPSSEPPPRAHSAHPGTATQKEILDQYIPGRKGHLSLGLTSLFQLVKNKMAAFTLKNCNVRLLIKCTAAEPPHTGGQALIKTAGDYSRERERRQRGSQT